MLELGPSSFHKGRVRFGASGSCQFGLLPSWACYFVGIPTLDITYAIYVIIIIPTLEFSPSNFWCIAGVSLSRFFGNSFNFVPSWAQL